MRDHGGSIVNITLGNRNGMPMMAHSGAARAGIENMSATLCSEWIESDVRINCVRPGIIWTDSGFVNYGGKTILFVPSYYHCDFFNLVSSSFFLLEYD